MTKSGASSEQPLIDARAWLADTAGLLSSQSMSWELAGAGGQRWQAYGNQKVSTLKTSIWPWSAHPKSVANTCLKYRIIIMIGQAG